MGGEGAFLLVEERMSKFFASGWGRGVYSPHTPEGSQLFLDNCS